MKSRRALKLAPSMLAVSICMLSACGQSGGTVSVDGSVDAQRGRKVKPAPPPTGDPSPTPAPAPASGYDTSIGSGVDTSGFAVLPLRSGAHRFFVSSASGNDGNGCGGAQNAATPLKTIAAGAACVTAGNGDQVLVAEGNTFAETLPNIDARGGNSAAYPTVIQSYDPSDPLNEGKYGHAANGRRPVLTGSLTAWHLTCCTTTPANFVAIRGLDLNPGNQPDQVLQVVGSGGLPNSYILIENNIFRYTALTFTQPTTAKATNIVIRKNAFYGSWSPTGHAQGVYGSGIDGFVIEDNIFWHTGWKVGASRDDTPANGGPTIFRHSVYAQVDTRSVVRRNLFMDPSATGCSCRGDTTISENVFIDNPLSIIAGLGDDYDTIRPNGVSIEVSYNAILGDADINSTNPRGGAITTGNGNQTSRAHHNLIARSRDMNAVNVAGLITQANYSTKPSYVTWDSNLVYQWSASKTTYLSGTTSQDLPTYTNNAWDAAGSGTNVNVSSRAVPNPLTAAALYVALACADKQTCASQMVETPELGWGAKARAILWQGYGL